MSGSIGLTPLTLYLTDSANEASRSAAFVRSDQKTATSIAYFKKVAAGLTTPDSLLKNTKALAVVLGAFNLSSSINDTAILRKLLTQDPTSKTSLSQKLGSAKYQIFANALSDWSTPPFASPASITQIINAFATNAFEAAADNQAPGLANALSLTREASSLKSIAAVQSDPNLLAVVVTSIGLPLQNFEELGFDQQTAILKSKFHPADLQKPAYVKRVAEQYLVSQQSSASTNPTPGSVIGLFSDASETVGDTLISILSSTTSGNTDESTGVLSLFA